MSDSVFTAGRLRELADQADTWEGSFAVCLSPGQARAIADAIDATARERDALTASLAAAREALARHARAGCPQAAEDLAAIDAAIDAAGTAAGADAEEATP